MALTCNNTPGAGETLFRRLEETIIQHMDTHDLDVGMLAGLMMMSRITLYRRIRLLSGLTPAEIITRCRLKKAAELLLEHKYCVWEVSDMVGFGSHSTLTRNFLRHYNMTPTAYRESKQKTPTDATGKSTFFFIQQ